MPSILISLVATGLLTLGFLAFSIPTRHWFAIPTLLCGIAIGIDAVDWIRGRLALLDPAGLIGLLGFHVFFLNPFLVAAWDHRMKYLPEQPDDYRPWLGLLSSIIFFGILAYRWRRSCFATVSASKPGADTVWRMHHRRFWIVLTCSLAVSGALQAWVYYSVGGISGYIGAYSSWLRGEEAFQGSAPIFAISESFPILLMMGFAVWSWGAAWRRNWLVLGGAVLTFGILALLFGGLRGSRSNTVWGLFWAVGIIHLYVRRVPRTVVVAAVPALLTFLAVYAVYKNQGDATFEFLSKANSYEDIQTGSERAEDILLGDLGRSDVQSFLLYRMFQRGGEFEYAWGRSYLGAVLGIIPRSLWPDRPPGKMRWTTEAEFGPGSYESGEIFSTRVYGLAGEAMLNFGPLVVPFAFLILGSVVGRLRMFIASLELGDSRRLLAPFLCTFCFLLLLNDSDNQVFYLFKYGLAPTFVILFSSGECIAKSATSRMNHASTDLQPRLASA